MNNKKMITSAKNLDILANVGGKITAAAGMICILVALATLLFGGKMFTDGSTTLDLDFIKFHLNDKAYVNETYVKYYVCISTVIGAFICFAVYYISTLLRKIFAPMKIGRPFETDTPGHLKKIGWIIIITGFIGEVLGVVSRILLINAYSIDRLLVSDAIAKTEYVFTMNINFIFIACAVFLLSYVFSYGQGLQQDSDETL